MRRRPFWHVRIKFLLGAFLALVVLHHAVLYFGQRWMLFPGVFRPATESALPAYVERIEIRQSEGTSYALYRAGAGATAETPKPLVVFAHGNYDTAKNYPWANDVYHSAGFNFLAVEYRGFEGADGTPSEAVILEDTRRLISEAAARPEVDGDEIIFHGHSLGAGVLGTLAGTLHPKRLILESGFSSVHSAARRYLAPRYLFKNHFDVAASLRDQYEGPVLILHSETDLTVPFGEALKNLDAAGDRATFIRRSGIAHGVLWISVTPDEIVAFARGEAVARSVRPRD